MKIPENVLAILSDSTIEGNVLKLNSGQLERSLYVATNKILDAMGGTWNRKVKGHVFDGCPVENLDRVLLTGEIAKPQDFGFFETPQKLAAFIAETADIEQGMLVLEPSAGRGALADEAVRFTRREYITCVEIQEANRKVLTQKGYCVFPEPDFLKVEPTPIYDRVIMNPPFAPSQAEIDHVLHAWEFLAPHGRLISIMSAGIVFRQNRKTVQFREMLDSCGSYERNEDGAFKKSGTMVNTITVVMDKERV